jgi:hypothetical protein
MRDAFASTFARYRIRDSPIKAFGITRGKCRAEALAASNPPNPEAGFDDQARPQDESFLCGIKANMSRFSMIEDVINRVAPVWLFLRGPVGTVAVENGTAGRELAATVDFFPTGSISRHFDCSATNTYLLCEAQVAPLAVKQASAARRLQPITPPAVQRQADFV